MLYIMSIFILLYSIFFILFEYFK